jgi:hypothetical protein
MMITGADIIYIILHTGGPRGLTESTRYIGSKAFCGLRLIDYSATIGKKEFGDRGHYPAGGRG